MNTHPEQRAAIYAASIWGFGAFRKGTSVVVLRVEGYTLYTVHSLPPPTIPANLRLEPVTFGLQVRLYNH